MALIFGEALAAAFLELTLLLLLARLKGVADPERPLTALLVFFTLDEALDGPEDVTLFLRVDFVGVGDLDVALEDAGVESLDEGVSLRLERLLDRGAVALGVSCSSESIRRWKVIDL